MMDIKNFSRHVCLKKNFLRFYFHNAKRKGSELLVKTWFFLDLVINDEQDPLSILSIKK